MDSTMRFSLREIYEAAKAAQPQLTYQKLYGRYKNAKKAGRLPQTASKESLTWEQARALLQIRPKNKSPKPRSEAVSILRKAIRDDGLG